MRYWERRQVEQKLALLDKTVEDFKKKLKKEYIRAINQTKQNLSDMYYELLDSSEDGTILMSDLYRYNRYYDLINDLNKELVRLGGVEVGLTDAALQSMYILTSEMVGNHIHFSTGYSATQMKRVIDTIWCNDGKLWSDRIWNDKEKLANRIEKGLVDCVASGATKEKLVKTLMDEMNTSFYCAERIARTELSYVQNQATLDKYNEAGIEYYEFLATGDSRTCDICQDLNGKKFRLSEAQVGVNYPPIHPNCRSSVLAVI